MARTVHCIKLEKEAEGLDFPPYPGDLGKRIWENVSKDAWAAWLKHQTMLVNENRLNLADLRARQYLARQMENHFFGQAWPAQRRRVHWPNAGGRSTCSTWPPRCAAAAQACRWVCCPVMYLQTTTLCRSSPVQAFKPRANLRKRNWKAQRIGWATVF